MDDNSTYELKIAKYTPHTLPMKRFAEYVEAFADLLGNDEFIAFAGLRAGSACILGHAREQSVPYINARLAGGSLTDGPPTQLERARKRLNDMLRCDGTWATVRMRKGRVFFDLPGVKERLPAPLEIHQNGSIVGRIIWLGGRDSTIPVHVVDDLDQEIPCDASLSLIRDLRNFVCEPVWFRFYGAGVWLRSAEGQWRPKRMRIQSFDQLSNESVLDAFTKLKTAGGGWAIEDDPVAAALSLRNAM